MSGLPASTFLPISGSLDLRPHDGPGSVQDADVLAGIDLEQYYDVPTDSARHSVIKPIIDHRGTEDDPDPERALYHALADFPPMGHLINMTMKQAIPVAELGRHLFPDASPQTADRAVNALMALGSAARENPKTPGLLPCRVHNFFRGLPGLWGCMDPGCSELSESESDGICGKLYSQPRESCHCGARVLELYTCRNCGTAYARAYTDDIDCPSSLWSEPGESLRMAEGETGPLAPLDLLLETPASDDAAEPADYDLETGRLNPPTLGTRMRRVYLRSDRLSDSTDEEDDDIGLAGLCMQIRSELPPEALLEQIVTTVQDRFLGFEPLALASLVERDNLTPRLAELPSIPGVAETTEAKAELARAWLRCWQGYGFWLGAMPPIWGQRPRSQGISVRARKGKFRAMQTVLADRAARKIFDSQWLPNLLAIFTEATANGFRRLRGNELLFQDIALGERAGSSTAVDVLSSTTTMEVGIDIGALSGVALRNMPPGRANYQQRSGRAGRRGNAVATVVAFGSADSHDEHYFANPDGMIRGDVVDPKLTLDNPDIVRRHIRAFLLQSYHQDRIPGLDPGHKHVLSSVPGTVADFRDPSSTLNRQDFAAWLAQCEDELRSRMSSWIPEEISPEARDTLLGEFAHDCLDAIDDAIGSERSETDASEESGEASESEYQPEEGEESPPQAGITDKLLDRLLYCGKLPRYAFPTDVATFHVFDIDRSTRFRPIMRFAPQQGLSVALSQYASGKQVWISGKCYTSNAIYSVNPPMSLKPGHTSTLVALRTVSEALAGAA